MTVLHAISSLKRPVQAYKCALTSCHLNAGSQPREARRQVKGRAGAPLMSYLLCLSLAFHLRYTTMAWLTAHLQTKVALGYHGFAS